MTTTRNGEEYATVTNGQTYTLALGCGGIGESGRYMEVHQGDSLQGDPPEYSFTVSNGSRQIHTGATEVLPARQDDGSTLWLATLDIAAVEALRKGNAIDVQALNSETQRFGLSGSLKAIDATAC